MTTIITDKSTVQIYAVSKIIFICMAFLLWVDSLTGMLQVYTGIDFKISLLYKLPLLASMILIIALKSRMTLLLVLVSFIFLIIGPAARFTENNKSDFLFNDISLAIKAITPFITFYFCKIIAKVHPDILGRYGTKVLMINLLAILFNLFVGTLGYGFPSYEGGEDGQGIGVRGFYVAGNELSGCFVLLFGFILHYCWNIKKAYFYPVAIVTAMCGALIATKTAMLASIILIFMVPIVNERKNLFRLTKLKVRLFLMMLVGVALATYFILDFLQSIGLRDKMMWILKEKGLLELIFSGRLDFVSNIMDAFMAGAGWFQYLFGIGTVGMSDFFVTKYSAEVDPVDLFVYVGAVGSTIVYAAILAVILPAFLMCRRDRFLPPVVVLVNLILLLLSVLSGHILTSGMLGPLWGLFNGLIFVRELNNRQPT
jgi:hypothetical protein